MATVNEDESGNRYMLVESQVNWLGARDACQNAGGQLAEITSAEENAAVLEIMEMSGVMNAWVRTS
eukprot:SAG11_NODE_7536_length_1133_cov_1.427466_2_plen_65_part_01